MSRLLLLLLLLLSLLGELARADDFGHHDGRLIRRDALGDKHADTALIIAVLGVLSGRDKLGQPRRPLEEQNQKRRSGCSPAVKRVRCEAAPLVQDEPDGLFGCKVGMSAVSPKPRSDEATVKIHLLEPARDLCRLSVLFLCCLIVCTMCPGQVSNALLFCLTWTTTYPIAPGLPDTRREQGQVRMLHRQYRHS